MRMEEIRGCSGMTKLGSHADDVPSSLHRVSESPASRLPYLVSTSPMSTSKMLNEAPFPLSRAHFFPTVTLEGD